jgi:Fic family protein
MWNKLNKLRQEFLDRGIMDSIDFEKFCMISIVYHSTRIEGCSLSETDTRVLLEKNITAQGKPLTDHLMVKDHFEAFKLVKQYAREKRKMSLELMKEVNAAVMKSTGGIVNSMAGSFDSSLGDLRLAQVYVDQKYFPDYSKVPELLNKLTEEINSRLDQINGIEALKLAADLHYNFVNIHPFADGNGRTARLLMNYIQLYHYEPLIKIFTEDRAGYIDALNETEAKHDPEIFRSFICRQQIKFLELELEKFEKGTAGFGMLF